MGIDAKNNPAKFHPDPISNDGARSLRPFLKSASPQQEVTNKEEQDK